MDTEVVIVGGALTGASLAAALADAGVSSVLVDRKTPILRPPAGFDQRVYAIRPAAVTFLQRCGIWGNVDHSRLCPVVEMRISGDDARSTLRFDAYRAGLGELAMIAEDSNLQTAARRTLEAKALVQTVDGCSVVGAVWGSQDVTVRLDNGSAIRALLAVAADGADSRLRALAGIETVTRKYEQRAVVANFRASRPHHGIAFQWFREDGVLALLPLPMDQVSMVWSTSEANADLLMDLDDSLLASRVSAASGDLGEMELTSRPASFSLQFMRARQTVAPRLVVVGDAAHNVHPLAGQGLNMGLGDCVVLAELLASRTPAESVASPGLLARYRRGRAEEVAAMQFVTDGLHRLFGSKTPAAKWLRNAGLGLVDRLTPLKLELVKRAVGRVV